MQSGIRASEELQQAFAELVINPRQRAIIATIQDELVQPLQIIEVGLQSNFEDDLSKIVPVLNESSAAFVLIRTTQNALAAITFVPEQTPVRQKMLYASSRTSLVRDLGADRFVDVRLIHDLDELTASTWSGPAKDHGAVDPATTTSFTGSAGQRLETGAKLNVRIHDDAHSILQDNSNMATPGRLLQFAINAESESIQLVDTKVSTVAELANVISASEPRYSIYSVPDAGKIAFFYTCPNGLGVRERMLYASSKQCFLNALASSYGMSIAVKYEVTDPAELVQELAESGPQQDTKTAFSRPKRPGRR